MFLYVCKQKFRKSKLRIFQEMKGVIMRNLCGTVFNIKTNVLQDFRICMSVPLNLKKTEIRYKWNLSIIEQKELSTLKNDETILK